jgi:hypothetical protein
VRAARRASAAPADDYQFESPVTFTHGDGCTSPGRIDCYRRGGFVLEAKKLKPGSAAAFDAALLAALAAMGLGDAHAWLASARCPDEPLNDARYWL